MKMITEIFEGPFYLAESYFDCGQRLPQRPLVFYLILQVTE